jgi:hypothetical protein
MSKEMDEIITADCRGLFYSRVFNPMSRRAKEKAGPKTTPAVRSGALGVEGSLLLEPASRMAGLSDHWIVSGVCIFLAAVIWLVFGQTVHHGFVNLDARRSARQAIELARAAGRQDMVEELNGELKLYAAGLPFHQESK